MPNNSRWHNYEEIVNAFLAILVMAGLISNPATDSRWFLKGTNKKKQQIKKNKISK